MEEPISSTLALGQLLDRAPALIGLVDAEHRYRFVNAGYAEMFDRDRRTILGAHVAEVVGRATYEALIPYIERALEGEPVSYERWVDVPRRGRRFWSTRYEPQVDRGRVSGFFVYVLDMTDKKLAEDRVAESEQRYRTIFENAAVGIARIGMGGEWLDVNEQLCSKLGYSRSELLRLTVDDITHPDDRADTARRAKALVSGEILQDRADKRYLRKDGSVMWGHLTASLVPGHDGQPPHIVAVVENITRRKEAEERLEASERKYRGLFEKAAVGMARVGPDGAWLDVNDQLCADLGYTREELLQLTFQEVTHPDDLEEDMRQAERLLRGEMDHHQMDKRYLRKDGTVHWAHLSAATVRDVSGKVSYFVSVMENITARKRAEEALHELARSLENRVEERTAELTALNNELESFNYTVSHDLRAPLRGIDGFTHALLEEFGHQLDPKGREYAGKVRLAAKRMGELIDALLGLSRLTRGDLDVRLVDMSAIARDIVAGLVSESPGRQVEVDVEPDLLVRADERLLRTALRNLLENSWKMTRDRAVARIWVGARTDRGETRYFVQDNGAGFDPRYAGRLFMPFQRLHSADEFEGLGIGLATVKRVVQRHGGRVWAEGTVGGGATFFFTLRNDRYRP